MNRLLAAFAALLILVIAPTGAARAAGPADFGNLPAIAATTISPGGTKLAWFANENGKPILVIQPLDGGRATVVPLGQNKPRRIIWSTDMVVLVEVSATTRFQGNYNTIYEMTSTISVDLATGNSLMLKVGGDSALNSIRVSRVASDGSGDVFISVYEYLSSNIREPTSRIGTEGRDDNAYSLALYRVDPVTGDTDDVARGDGNTVGFIMGRDDTVLARVDFDGETGKTEFKARDGGGWRNVVTVENARKGSLDFAGLEPGGDGVFMLDTRTAVAKLVRLDLASGAITPVAGITGSVTGVRTDPHTGDAVYTVSEGAEPVRTYLDRTIKAVRENLGRAFPGKIIVLSGWDRARTKFVISVDGPSDIPTWQILDTQTKQVLIIGEEYPGLVGSALGTQSLISFAARDGTQIPAYLTMPPGGATKNLPLIVLPHGGPEARDYAGFDWLAQFLATRGYVVLQPQFRGSDGFGKAWADAGRGEWGGLMQDDVTDGVKHLLANGTADPAKVCIVGWSYGGYAALAGAAFTPELYKCAVSINGVSDLPEMIGWVSNRAGEESGSVNYWRDHIGNAMDPEVAAASPARHADGVRAPVLLIHGKEDTVVPFQQSQKMERALRDLGKPVTLIEVPGEDHNMSRAATRIRMLEELGKFLAQHLGG